MKPSTDKSLSLLTVGMLVFNEEKHIASAIDSLLAQTFRDFVFIISDNGSTDRTADICRQYAAEDSRIIFIRHPENQGGFFNFNYILDRVQTPFFMFCAGHDQYDHRFIEKLMPAISQERVVLAYPRTAKIDDTGFTRGVYEDDYTNVGSDNPWKRYFAFVSRFGIYVMIYGIWRTKVIKNCRLPKPVIASDRIMLEQAVLEGCFKQIDEVLFYRRLTGARFKKYKYERQFQGATGQTPNFFRMLIARITFIIEHMRMFYRVESSLSFYHKFTLSSRAVLYGFRRFFYKPLRQQLSEILRILLKRILSF